MALNVEPEEDSEEEIDDTKEIQVWSCGSILLLFISSKIYL